MKKLKKYCEYLFTKIIRTFTEKQIEFDINGESVKLKYLLEKNNKSKHLVVVFSACTRKGIKARYNYVRTLKEIEVNKLFILDDFAEDGRGAYYFGRDCNNFIEISCRKLIQKIITELKIEKVIMCGSSKGGYAALNLMTEFDNADAIIGAPQYKLANYLMAPALVISRNYILGSVTKEKIEFLNSYLQKKLENSRKGKHKVYIHYSDREHTYDDHITYLMQDLTRFGYDIEVDLHHYTDHWDVSKYFPDYLISVLKFSLKS